MLYSINKHFTIISQLKIIHSDINFIFTVVRQFILHWKYCEGIFTLTSIKDFSKIVKVHLVFTNFDNHFFLSNWTMESEPKIIIVPDGCLFRCFLVFLYSTQNSHYKIRIKIVNFIVENRELYKNVVNPIIIICLDFQYLVLQQKLMLLSKFIIYFS